MAGEQWGIARLLQVIPAEYRGSSPLAMPSRIAHN
jgi:hypothetical protein